MRGWCFRWDLQFPHFQNILIVDERLNVDNYAKALQTTAEVLPTVGELVRGDPRTSPRSMLKIWMHFLLVILP